MRWMLARFACSRKAPKSQPRRGFSPGGGIDSIAKYLLLLVFWLLTLHPSLSLGQVGELGRANQASVVTVDVIADVWLDHAKANGKRTLAADQRHLRIAGEFFSRTPVTQLKPRDITRYRLWLSQRLTPNGRRLAPGTVVLHLAALRAALNHAVREGLIDSSPAASLKMPPLRNERSRIATTGELRALMEAAPRELRMGILLAAETGLRQANIANLRWSQIDLTRRLITIRASETKQGRTLRAPLSSSAVAALAAWEGPSKPHGSSRVKKPADALFSQAPKSMSVAFTRLCRGLGLRDLRFHDLRHTAATAVRRAGVDLFTLMRMFGWSSVATARRYQTVDDDELVSAIDKRPPIV